MSDRPSLLRRLAAAWRAGRTAWRTAAADHEMRRQHQILQAVTEALPATVVVVDAQGRYRYVNSAFARYAGRAAADLIGCTAADVLGAEELARRRPFMQRAMAGEPVSFVLDYPGDDGTAWLAMSCIPIRLDGVVEGFVGIGQDITVQRREQERLQQLAERDPMTGLLNRAGLAQRVARPGLLKDADEADELVLLYIDLDHFKAVNDTLGHAAGDRLLQRFARRLLRAVRSSDAVARLGGDEFAILLAGRGAAGAVDRVAENVLAAAQRPFDLGGRVGLVGASIGVAVLPRGQATLDELLRHADRQLYRAKAAGRGRHCRAAPGEAELPAPPEPPPGGLDTAPQPLASDHAPLGDAPAAPAARSAGALRAPPPQRVPAMPGAPGTPMAPPVATARSAPPRPAEPADTAPAPLA